VLQSGIDLPYKAIKSNIGDSVDLVVQLERRSGIRRVSEALSVRGYDLQQDEYRLEPRYGVKETSVARHG
jgi:Flp pilus assembly CpaF family ATPase